MVSWVKVETVSITDDRFLHLRPISRVTQANVLLGLVCGMVDRTTQRIGAYEGRMSRGQAMHWAI